MGKGAAVHDEARSGQHWAAETPTWGTAIQISTQQPRPSLACAGFEEVLDEGMPARSHLLRQRFVALDSRLLARACASWRSQDIVCPGVSPGGSNGTGSRQVANSAALPRRCVAVAPRRRGSAALPATSRVRSVQEPGSASPRMNTSGHRNARVTGPAPLQLH
ncbi:MAG: hypothetical protein RIT24_2469 [Planctomycetota bacterium]